MNHDHDLHDLEWSRLTRYLAGDLSPAEAAAVERWFDADPRHRVLLDELREVWLVTAGETDGWNTERTIAELRRRASPPQRRSAAAGGGHRRAPSFVTARRRPWVGWAAGLAASILIGAFALQGLPWRDRDATGQAPSTEMTDIVTRRAQRSEVRLADGSRVILGPDSRLSYAADFQRGDRTVVLDGEAYFDVVHDAAKPFRVRTARGVAEDIGTAFVVRARGSQVRVVVTEGAVVLRPISSDEVASDSIVLMPGQLGRIREDGRLDRVIPVDTNGYLAWTRGDLAFEDAALADVAEELSRWYDVDIRVPAAADAARRFSGHLGDRTVEEAVQLVAAVADVAARRIGNGWVFQGRSRS